MKNLSFFQFMLGTAAAVILTLLSCTKKLTPEFDSGTPGRGATMSSLHGSLLYSGVHGITGYNQNWSALPALNSTLLNNIVQLSPQMIRYPGGTVTHKWDWVSGKVVGRPNSVAHPLSDLNSLVTATNAKVMFVLDIVHSTLEDQVDMLEEAINQGLDVEYIELGNELYSRNHNYPDSFPSGTDYARKASKWADTLKAAFPDATIAALLVGKTVNSQDSRGLEWNEKVTQYVHDSSENIGAYTFHIYVNQTQTLDERITDFETIKSAIDPFLTGKQIWITEYGVQKEPTHPDYYTELEFLADYVESFADIALSHTIIAFNPTGSKLDETGSTFTAEGNMFLDRVSYKASPIPAVFNEIYNSQAASGADDAVELLVTKNILDMRGMILKKFSGTMANDDMGARYTFKDTTLWKALRKGTLIVIGNNAGTSSADITTGGSDYNLHLNINDTRFFEKDNSNSDIFDVVNTRNMWMLKEAGSGTSGISGNIHTLFGGASTSPLFGDISTGAKIYSPNAWSPVQAGGRSVYCKNTNALLSDFNDTSGNGAAGRNGSYGSNLGTANDSAGNEAFINDLRTSW